MRAAVLSRVPGRLAIEDVEVAEPVGREVLVRVAAAGLCHTDLHFMEGAYPHPLPTVLGHESAGVVEAVGEGVTAVQPGDHVITCLSVFCGACEYCLSGRPALCDDPGAVRRPDDEPSRLRWKGEPIHQFLHLSSFGERMLVHENGVVRIRPEMPFDRAALIGCSVITGVGAVFRTARVEPGQSVAVLGCGGVGLNVVQGARLAGAARIIAIDRFPEKLHLAERFGATDLVDAGRPDPVAEVRRLADGGVHHSFEALGSAETAEQAFAMIRRGGTATLIGLIPVGTKVSLPGHQFLQEKKVQGCMMGSNRFREDMPRLVDLYLSGRLLLDELISRHLTLDEVNSGFEDMRNGRRARSVIRFEE